jgi:hypothetical protein
MNASLIGLIMGILALAAIAPASLDAQTSAPPTQAAPLYSPAQLDQLLAPVALYPDQLLGQILMASTYPLEVVEAARWVEDPNDARLKGDQLAAVLQDKDWDPSVKSLAPFPQILRMMDDRLDWMQKLGDAFPRSTERSHGFGPTTSPPSRGGGNAPVVTPANRHHTRSDDHGRARQSQRGLRSRL